jgi:hypothetical protein
MDHAAMVNESRHEAHRGLAARRESRRSVVKRARQRMMYGLVMSKQVTDDAAYLIALYQS